MTQAQLRVFGVNGIVVGNFERGGDYYYAFDGCLVGVKKAEVCLLAYGSLLEHLGPPPLACEAAPPLPAPRYAPQHAPAIAAQPRPGREHLGHLDHVVVLLARINTTPSLENVNVSATNKRHVEHVQRAGCSRQHNHELVSQGKRHRNSSVQRRTHETFAPNTPRSAGGLRTQRIVVHLGFMFFILRYRPDYLIGYSK